MQPTTHIKLTSPEQLWQYPLDECQTEELQPLVHLHEKSDSPIPFLVAVIVKNNSTTIAEGIRAQKCYVPTNLSDKTALTKMTRIDFYAIRFFDTALAWQASLQEADQVNPEVYCKVNRLVDCFNPKNKTARLMFAQQLLRDNADDALTHPIMQLALKEPICWLNSTSFTVLGICLSEEKEPSRERLTKAVDVFQKVIANFPYMKEAKVLLGRVAGKLAKLQ
jgi:hypothetical protein